MGAAALTDLDPRAFVLHVDLETVEWVRMDRIDGAPPMTRQQRRDDDGDGRAEIAAVERRTRRRTSYRPEIELMWLGGVQAVDAAAAVHDAWDDEYDVSFRRRLARHGAQASRHERRVAVGHGDHAVVAMLADDGTVAPERTADVVDQPLHGVLTGTRIGQITQRKSMLERRGVEKTNVHGDLARRRVRGESG